jgi:hypothetical protein
VGAEIKSMEKVFMKVLPAFTENVSQLSKITETLEESTGTKRPKLALSEKKDTSEKKAEKK